MSVYRVGLVGTGIQNSQSPTLHMAEGISQGLDYKYEIIDLALQGGAAALPRIIDRMVEQGFSGCNITHPVKQAVIPLLHRLDEHANAIAAVNTVTILPDGTREGYNTDWIGFGDNLRRGLGDVPLGRVVLVGAGGAGSAAAYALGRMGAARIVVVDTEPQRAKILAMRLISQGFPASLGQFEELETLLAAADGLVHATPTGSASYPGLPVPTSSLRPDLWVAEIVYVPLETELVREARLVGARVVDGGGMVVLQAAAAFDIFTGRTADRNRMMRHFTTRTAA